MTVRGFARVIHIVSVDGHDGFLRVYCIAYGLHLAPGSGFRRSSILADDGDGVAYRPKVMPRLACNAKIGRIRYAAN